MNLNERRVLSDRVQERVARKERVAGEAFFDRHAQPLQGFFALAPQRVDAGDVVSAVMISTVSSLLFQNRRDRRLSLLVFPLQSQ